MAHSCMRCLWNNALSSKAFGCAPRSSVPEQTLESKRGSSSLASAQRQLRWYADEVRRLAGEKKQQTADTAVSWGPRGTAGSPTTTVASNCFNYRGSLVTPPRQNIRQTTAAHCERFPSVHYVCRGGRVCNQEKERETQKKTRALKKYDEAG